MGKIVYIHNKRSPQNVRAHDRRATHRIGKQAEVELKTGLELMGKDKKTIQDLIALVDPPTTQ